MAIEIPLPFPSPINFFFFFGFDSQDLYSFLALGLLFFLSSSFPFFSSARALFQ